MVNVAGFQGFKSEFQDNPRLVQCAQFDPSHFAEGYGTPADWQGEHVKLAQKALNAWAGRNNVAPIPASEAQTGFFGKETTRVVLAFKSKKKPPILNYLGKIDPIIGKLTIRALDEELPAVQVKTLAKTVDFVVAFIPAGHRGIPFETYPSFISGRAVSAAANARQDRRVEVLVFGAVMPAAGDVLRAIPAKLGGDVLGRSFLYGISAGGKVVIQAARSLPQFPALVGVSDGAFAHADCDNLPVPPAVFALPKQMLTPLNVPTIKSAVVSCAAAERLNFFQSAANRCQFISPVGGGSDIRAPIMWTSHLNGEVHGDFGSAWQNQDLNSNRSDSGSASDLHVAAALRGEDLILQRIRTLLDTTR